MDEVWLEIGPDTLGSWPPRHRRGLAAVCLACALFAGALFAASCHRKEPVVRHPAPPPPAARPVARPVAKVYLGMPPNDAGPVPLLLSQTGAFADVRLLSPAEGLLPYEVNVPFWSDGAAKRRWVALPHGTPTGTAPIHFAATGPWGFPNGTVFVKHFELPPPTAERPGTGRPRRGRRLETRLLVRDDGGGVYGASYRWRADESDADLVREGQQETLAAEQGAGPSGSGTPGARQEQPWYFPGPADCRVCHTAAAGYVLGVNTRQLNRDRPTAPGLPTTASPCSPADNQLAAWNRLGLFEPPLAVAGVAALLKLVPADGAASLETRARSYLDANCSHCHRPGGTPGYFDARFETPLGGQNLVGGPVLIDFGVDRARVIAPNDVWRSTLLSRLTTLEQPKMPPLGHEVLDAGGAELIRQWVLSLPGPTVVAPPAIEPPGGTFPGPTRVRLRHDDPAAVIHYTLDGSSPGKSSAVYREPIEVSRPTTIRAKAYKEGATRSVTVQQTFVVGD